MALNLEKPVTGFNNDKLTGVPFTVTLRVFVTGVSPANDLTGVTISDPNSNPGGTRTWTVNLIGGATLTSGAMSGSGAINSVADIPVGGEVQYIITETVNAPASYENIASATHPTINNGDPLPVTSGVIVVNEFDFSCIDTSSDRRDTINVTNNNVGVLNGWSMYIEVSEDNGVTWSEADLFNGPNPVPNPTDFAFPGSFNTIGNLQHNTTYMTRSTLVLGQNTSQPVAGTTPIVCGPVTTGNYPVLECNALVNGNASDITTTTATMSINTKDPATGAPYWQNTDPDPDTTVWHVGTTPGGPYPLTFGPQDSVRLQNSFATGLTPGTQYYFYVEYLQGNHGDPGNEPAGVIATGPECTFTTLPLITNAPPTPETEEQAKCAEPVTICRQTGTQMLCDLTDPQNPVPIILVTITSADGDVIPTTSTEFPAAGGAGVFSTMGFYRSYYTDRNGAMITPPAAVGACLTPEAPDDEQVCYQPAVVVTPPVACNTAAVQTIPAAPQISGATVVANPGNFTVDNLDQSHNGVVGSGEGVQLRSGTASAPGTVIDYTLSTPGNNVFEMRLFNGYGAGTNPGNGIAAGSATYTVFDSSNAVLASGTLVSTNLPQGSSGQGQDTTVFPTVLNDVARIRISGFGIQNGPDISWRELSLRPLTARTLTWTCGNTVITGTLTGPAEGGAFYNANQQNLLTTGGPMTLTFTSPDAFTGTIVAPTPGRYSTLNVANGTAVTIQDASEAFAVNFLIPAAGAAAPVQTLVGYVRTAPDGTRTLHDASTNAVVTGGTIVNCQPEPEPDVEWVVLCDTNQAQGQVTRFLRRLTTLSGITTAADFALDGTTAYTPTGVVGACSAVLINADNEPGCANGVPYTRRRFVYSDASTGQQLAVVYGYFDSANNETQVAPAGFTLGACSPCTVSTERGVLPSWG